MTSTDKQESIKDNWDSRVVLTFTLVLARRVPSVGEEYFGFPQIFNDLDAFCTCRERVVHLKEDDLYESQRRQQMTKLQLDILPDCTCLPYCGFWDHAFATGLQEQCIV